MRICGEAGACFGSKMGWERPIFSRLSSQSRARIEYALAACTRTGTHWVAAEHRACREAVALFDMRSFAKFLVKGRDAERLLQSLVANECRGAGGPTVYTGMLNERGGYEATSR